MTAQSGIRLTVVLFVLLGLCGTAAMHAAERRVRGVVSDESKGVLPGVTVVAMAGDGAVLTTAVTDGSGHYELGPLTPGRIIVTFQLAGFSTAAVRVTVTAEADVVVDQRMVVAPQSETVLVYGKVPAPPPPPPPPPPHRTPETREVPEHDHDSVCGPAKLGAMPESFGTVRSRRFAANGLYAAGDELVIDGGTASGLQVGQNFAVRRSYRVEWEPRTEIGEHTAGVVQIVAAEEQTAVAVVIYACDDMRPGDRLASFQPEPIRQPLPSGKPDYKQAARILFPDVGQLLGAPRRLMVIDRGTESGVAVGQRVTLFRRRASSGGAPSIVGQAIVVAVRADSATIRVAQVTDAVFFGDWAAPQRQR